MVSLTSRSFEDEWTKCEYDSSEITVKMRWREGAALFESLRPSRLGELDNSMGNTEPGRLQDLSNVTESVAAEASLFDAEITKILPDRVECWVRVTPQFRVKMYIDKELMEDIPLVRGVCFEWSQSRQVARPCQVDPELAKEIAELERQH